MPSNDSDPASGLVPESSTYCAAPAVRTVPIGEPVAFDHEGRGHHMEPPG